MSQGAQRTSLLKELEDQSDTDARGSLLLDCQRVTDEDADAMKAAEQHEEDIRAIAKRAAEDAKRLAEEDSPNSPPEEIVVPTAVDIRDKKLADAKKSLHDLWDELQVPPTLVRWSGIGQWPEFILANGTGFAFKTGFCSRARTSRSSSCRTRFENFAPAASAHIAQNRKLVIICIRHL